MAKNLDAELSRIQFTPDLLPSDITGSEVYFTEGGKGEFRFQQGPIFANLILADEVNRAPAKVQSALLEAMEERQVTVGGDSHELPDLFMVMATQNPIEQEGTYPCPRRNSIVSSCTFRSITPTPSRRPRSCGWCGRKKRLPPRK